MSKERDNNNNNNNNNHSWKPREKEEYYKLRAWGILLFGLIGAAATTLAQSKSQSFSSWRSGASRSGWASYREEAWKRYNHRMQQEYEQEMERVERIRRMQNIFNRERNKCKRSYERWREYGPGAYQHYREDEWYWRTDTSYHDDSTDYRFTPTYGGNNSMSHHYSVLGLDRSRAEPYSDAEIKAAFRTVAMKYHPDQNQGDKEAAETKFKEVMASYEAIKLERKNAR